MPFPHRIEKQYRSAKLGSRRAQGRGRPSDWSSAWQKKLIVLRLCGLQLKVILQLFNVLGDGIFKAKERRAQQLLREILYTGYTLYCEPSKDALQKRVAFLRAMGNRDQLRRAKRRLSRSDSLPSLAINRGTKYKISDQLKSALKMLDSSTSTAEDLESNNLPANEGSDQSEHVLRNENPESLSTLRTWSFQKCDSLNPPIPSDAQSVGSSRSAKIRGILRKASYSSSVISEIQSVLNIRFSLSTLASSSRRSVSMSSTMNDEGVRHLDLSKIKENPTPSTILDLHRRKALQANAALINMCCSDKPDCLHGYIKDVIIADSQRALAEKQCVTEQQANDITLGPAPDTLASCQKTFEVLTIRLKAFLSGSTLGIGGHFADDLVLRQINDPDVYGNTALFFAARCGAPIKIIIDMLSYVIDINTLNDDGQTFLFFLDPENVPRKQCHCNPLLTLQHPTEFECLIRQLEARQFDFNRIDHNGRHFLSYLCLSPSFQGNWLIDLAECDLKWRERLKHLWRLRDSSGFFLQDYLGVNPNNEELTKYITERCLPTFPWTIPGDVIQRKVVLLKNNFDEEFLWTRAFLREPTHKDQLLLLPDYIKENINNYDKLGYTLLIAVLHQTVGGTLDEKTIVERTRYLVDLGANINARARDGSTLLHFAAKRSYPELIQYTLSAGIQANCRDEAGFTALDYAAENLTRSRTLSAPVGLTARSFKAAIPLLEYASYGMSKIRKNRRFRESGRELNVFELLAQHSESQAPTEGSTEHLVS